MIQPDLCEGSTETYNAGLFDASLNDPVHLICPACLMGPARLIGPACLIGPARLTILKKNSLPACLTEPARLTIFRKKSTLLA